MARVRRMRTQNAAYWREQFHVTEEDIDFLTGVILEHGQPRSAQDLALALMQHYIQKEREHLSKQVTEGRIYRPSDTHQVGQVLVFTEFDWTQGTVIATREGYHPDYKGFQVIRVAMEESGEEKEFASSFNYPHALNRPIEELIGGAPEDATEEEIIQANLPIVTEKIENALRERPEWVSFNNTWFLEALLPEVHVGHLNLAEALIYEAERPRPVEEMLPVLELDAASGRDAQIFALNHALAHDPAARFVNVGQRGQNLWFLRALMPAEVFERPQVSRGPFAATGNEYIGLTMLDWVEELGDELDSLAPSRNRNGRSLSFQVNFPHLYAGTMPASKDLLALIGEVDERPLGLDLIDGRTGQSYKGWLVANEGYIAGLKDWYADVGMVVGGIVTVSSGETPTTLILHVTPRRESSEWVRVANVRDGELVIEMQLKRMGGPRYDPETLIEINDPEAIARLMWQSYQTNQDLKRIVRAVVLELAKLSPRGVAHCKAIYSAVNMYRRSGAVPIFAILTRNACFDPIEHGSWAYDPSLEGQVYETPEEMRERPLSRRSDLFKDQVVRYGGN